MTWRAVGVGTLLLLTGCSADPAGGCTGAEITLSTTTPSPGEELRVQARRVLDDCDDGNGVDVPARDVEIVLVPADGSPELVLTTVDADAEGRIDVLVRLPGDAPAGAAEIDLRDHGRAAIEVTAP